MKFTPRTFLVGLVKMTLTFLMIEVIAFGILWVVIENSSLR